MEDLVIQRLQPLYSGDLMLCLFWYFRLAAGKLPCRSH